MGEHFDAGLRALELELDEGLPYLKTGALLGRARRELLGEELLIIGKAGALSEPHEKGSRIDAASFLVLGRRCAPDLDDAFGGGMRARQELLLDRVAEFTHEMRIGKEALEHALPNVLDANSRLGCGLRGPA